MDLRPQDEIAGSTSEVRRLRRLLARERARREAAESIGEKATADLYETVLELQRAQDKLLDLADQSRVVTDLGRALRQDLDPLHMVQNAAESVCRATGVDRCDVLMLDTEDHGALHASWRSTPAAGPEPRPRSFDELPASLRAVLLDAAHRLTVVRIDDVEDHPQLAPPAAAEIVESLGARALAAIPVAISDQVAGWLILQALAPRTWRKRDIGICQGLSHDLATSLIQASAFEREHESVLRLEELDRAKDSFISTVSHELRTPLTSIVGYLELISQGGLGPMSREVAQGMGIIERNVDRLRALVDDLLTLSAYDAAQVHVQIEPIDLLEAVTSVREELLPAAAARDVRVSVAADGDLPRVPADRHHIDRVVQNLLSNAIKFNRRGGTVELGLSVEDSSMILSVADTGIGIPADEQEGLFERFFRSSLSVEDEIQGTGLGLALVRAVVEWHDGTVGIESTEGEGTTVTVRLPLAP